MQEIAGKTTKNIQALEVRYVIYDVFGEHMTTLSWELVADINENDSYDFLQVAGRWAISANDASQFLSSVAFVAEARTSDGKIWRYNPKAISDELLKIQSKAADIDLIPKREK